MDRLLLEAGLLYETIRVQGYQLLVSLNNHIEAACEAYDQKHYVRPQCRKSIICSCERPRCPGRTTNITTYARRISQG